MSVMAVMAGLVEARLDAVKVELMQAFQDHLDRMLVEIADDYKLDLAELQEKYEMVYESGSESRAPAKAPAKRAPRKVKDSEERKKCAAKTAKGAACKNFALVGCEFCACHSKAKAPKESKVQKMRRDGKKGQVKPVSPPSSDSESDSENEIVSPVKSPVKPQKRPTRKAQVKHSHPMDKEVHEECEACEVIGNGAVEDECSVMVDDDVKKVLDDLFEGSGSDTEDDE